MGRSKCKSVMERKRIRSPMQHAWEIPEEWQQDLYILIKKIYNLLCIHIDSEI